MYIKETGCQWRVLLENYPPWQTVYWYFRKWTVDGTIELAHQEIRKAIRKQVDKNAYCSTGVMDCISVQLNATSGHSKGFDGNKQIKGMKRHTIVDSLGLVINVVTQAANIHDSVRAKQVFEKVLERR
ncbi:MAG: transposase [Chitinophagaceae bacterium]